MGVRVGASLGFAYRGFGNVAASRLDSAEALREE